VINISLFELFHKNLDYEFLRYYSMCYTVGASRVVPFISDKFHGFLRSRGQEMLLLIENYHVSFAKHPYENRTLL